MKHKSKKRMVLATLFCLGGLIVSFSSNINAHSNPSKALQHFQEWKHFETPKELRAKDQWYDLS